MKVKFSPDTRDDFRNYKEYLQKLKDSNKSKYHYISPEGEKKTLINLMEFPLRSPRARGFLLGSNKLEKLTHQRYLTAEELEEIRSRIIIDEEPEDEDPEDDVPEEKNSGAFKVAPVKIPHSAMVVMVRGITRVLMVSALIWLIPYMEICVTVLPSSFEGMETISSEPL